MRFESQQTFSQIKYQSLAVINQLWRLINVRENFQLNKSII